MYGAGVTEATSSNVGFSVVTKGEYCCAFKNVLGISWYGVVIGDWYVMSSIDNGLAVIDFGKGVEGSDGGGTVGTK